MIYRSIVLIDDDLPVALPVGEKESTARALTIGPDERVDVAAIETASGLTIATHRKIGWRYWPGGQVMAQDLNLEDTARQAVANVLALELVPDSRAPARSAKDRYEEATRLGSLVHDLTVWRTRPIPVDDALFALFVTTTADGQAAVADLGPVRLALYGPAIPDGLTLQLAPLRSLTLEIPPRDDDDDDE